MDDICFTGLPELDENSLEHYGIQKQKWGVRRFQYQNGSYTPEGRERYRKGDGQRRHEGSREEEPKKPLKERIIARVKEEPKIIAKNIVKKHIPVFALKDDELRNINERLQLEESVLHLSGRLSPQDHRRTTHSVFTGLVTAGVKTIETFATGGAKAFWDMKGGGKGGKDSDPTKYEKITTTVEFDKNGGNPKATKSVVEKHKKIGHESSDSGVIFTGLPELDDSSLEHWGIMGMKWGLRRWQNPDGTLTPAGKERYYGGKHKDEANLFRYSQSFSVINRAGKNRGRAAAVSRNEIVRATLAEMKSKKLKPGTKEYSAALTKVIKGLLGEKADKEVGYSEAAVIGAAAGGALGGSIGALGGALGGAALNSKKMDIRKAKDWLKEDITVLNKYYPDLSPTNNPSVWDQLKRD